jgi:hypothetical protein
MKKTKLFLAALFFAAILSACSTIVLKPVNYAWPVENVVPVASDFNIAVPRYSLTINIKPILKEEKLIKNNSPIVNQIRLIRDDKGYFYLTGELFKNVYVITAEEGEMEVENKIFISNKGMVSPAMNYRNGYIELLLNDGKKILKINNDGILK